MPAEIASAMIAMIVFLIPSSLCAVPSRNACQVSLGDERKSRAALVHLGWVRKNAGSARARSLDCAPKREEKYGKNRPALYRDGAVFAGYRHGARLLHGRCRRWHRSRYPCRDSSPGLRNFGGLWRDLSPLAGDEGESPCARAIL